MKAVARSVGTGALFVGLALLNLRLGAVLATHRGATTPPLCMGGPSSTSRLVYLHGLDSLGPSWQELGNRAVLARLARELNLRIALPRGPQCGSGRCWPHESGEQRTALRRTIEAAAASCFGDGEAYGVLGFSNGGFAAATLYEACELRHLDRVVLSGSGGFIDASNTHLEKCGSLMLLIGEGDRYHRDIARQYYRQTRLLDADVELVEYDGGHRLDYGALRSALGRPPSERKETP